MKELVTDTPKGMALANPPLGTWGTEEADGSDIRLHKLLLMHGLSKLVGEEKANMGDIVDSITSEKLGDSKNPVAIIPIHSWRDWIIMEEIQGKFEFKARIPYGPENAQWKNKDQREYVEGGVKMRRDYALNFLVLQEKFAKDPGTLPMVITFKRTGLAAGSAMTEVFFKARQLTKPACFFTVNLGAAMEKGDKGNYYVPTISGTKATSDFDEVSKICYQWYQTFKTGAATVDDSDISTEDITPTGGAKPASDKSEFKGKF